MLLVEDELVAVGVVGVDLEGHSDGQEVHEVVPEHVVAEGVSASLIAYLCL